MARRLCVQPFQAFMLCLLIRIGQCTGEQTYLRVHDDILQSDGTITEDELKTFQLNYTLMNVSTESNAMPLVLTICVSTEDSDIATISYLDSKTFNLQTNPSGRFNFSVKGLFVGRTYIHLRFVFSPKRLTSPCDQHTGNSFTQTGDSFNLTSLHSSAENRSISYGSRYEVVVVRAERAIDVVFNVVVILLVFLVNLGLGCKTEVSVIKEVLRRPIAPITGFCSQFIIMPLISFGAVKLFNFEPALALGFFALGCSPGGSASNAYTLFLGGDVSLSITMTLISTIAALGMVPLWLLTLGRDLYKNTTIKIPYQNIFYSLLGLVIPVAIGLLIQYKRPRWAEVMVKVSKVLMLVFLVFVLSVGVYANLYIFRLMSAKVLLTAALLPYLGFILGGIVALICRMPRHRIVTIAVETGIQNTGIAIVLLLLSLPHPESDISITAPITSAIFTPLPIWVAIAVRYIYQRCCRAHKPLPKEDTGRNEDHDMASVLPQEKERAGMMENNES